MKKRILAALCSAALLAGTVPHAHAASDITGHWANKYITYLNQQGVMNPSATTGEYVPGAKVTRAEFMRYINRAFHFTEKADIAYTDVKASDWYYETVQIATKYGYIAGVGDNKMDPGGFVTREQAATIIGRLYKTATAEQVAPSQLTFSDKAAINTWSAGFIHDAVQKGYIVGYPDGTFLPKNTVTRAEVARILYSYLGNSLGETGKPYTGMDFRDDVENATISEMCTLSDAEIGGDLYITEGVGTGKIVLRDVIVNGTLIISGGSVTLDNVDAPAVVVGSSMNRLVQVTTTGNTNIAAAEVKSTAQLTETALGISASGFSDIALRGDEKTALTLASKVWDLDVYSKSAVALASGAAVNKLGMHAGGTVTGSGTIGTADITANGSNIGIQPVTYQLASGVTAVINGKTVKSDTAVALTPSAFAWDKAGKAQENAYDFTFTADPKTLDSVVLAGGKTLQDGTDYRATENGFRLYRTFLTGLQTEGSHILELTFADGGKARLTITVTDSGKNTLAPQQAVFDKYPGAVEYDDVSFTLTPAAGVQLAGIKVSGATLTRGKEYAYNQGTGTVTLYADYLAGRAAGELTVTFTMTGGNNLSAQLIIKDSTPVNKLSAESKDFDANTEREEYGDLYVTLEAVDGAKLKNIIAVGPNKTLEEDWQYRISASGEVSINRSALQSFATDNRQYVDLRFVMTTGVNPVLRVNYVTTYPVRVTVLDTEGKAQAGAGVTLKPDTSDSDKFTEAQAKNTDSYGTALFYVKNGSYVAEIKGGNFETVSKPVRIAGAGQNVNAQVAIQENVSITVMEASGSKIGGATVTLGNQSKTTGADGTVTFEMVRGSYTLTVSAVGYQTYTETYQVANSIEKPVRMKR